MCTFQVKIQKFLQARAVSCIQTSSVHVFDPKDRVLVTCFGVFYVGRCRKMVCAPCRGGGDILTLLDIRGAFFRYSMYGGHFAAT